MKRIALTATALAGLMIAVPASAQYSHGYSHGQSGYDHHDYGHHDYGHSYDRYHGYGHGYGYGYRGHYSRPHVECRVERGYYGPERRCFTVYR